MSSRPSIRPSDDESIEARAAAWLAQRDAGWSELDAREFEKWLLADPRHSRAVARLESTWSALQALRSYRPSALIHPDPDLLSISTPTPCFRKLSWILSIAAALIGLVVGGWLIQNASPRHHRAHYATADGGYERATLEDGSVVELNARTSLDVDYTEANRRVILSRGEAHFTVARNQRRPFWVESRGVCVRAVGTAFDVKLATSSIDILVTAGLVELRALAPRSILSTFTPTPASPPIGAGWRATWDATEVKGARLEKISLEQMRDLLSWQSLRLSFVEMPLGEVVEQFNQRNDLQLRLQDADLARQSIGGSFAADNVEAFVRLLTSSGDIVADRTNPNEIVLRKAHEGR